MLSFALVLKSFNLTWIERQPAPSNCCINCRSPFLLHIFSVDTLNFSLTRRHVFLRPPKREVLRGHSFFWIVCLYVVSQLRNGCFGFNAGFYGIWHGEVWRKLRFRNHQHSTLLCASINAAENLNSQLTIPSEWISDSRAYPEEILINKNELKIMKFGCNNDFCLPASLIARRES